MKNRKNIIVIFFSLICYSIYGAPLSHLDSLVMKCETTKSDSAKIYLLNTISGIYNDRGYADPRSLDAAQEALSIAIKRNNFIGMIYAYLNTGCYFQLKGDAKQALDNFLKAQDIAEKNNVNSNLGNV